MGKSNRGKMEESMRQYGDPGFERTSGMAQRSGDIYYGAPGDRTAQPVDGGEPTGEPTDGAEQGVNYNRVYEVYRWWVRKTGGDPSRLREHPHLMGDAEWRLLDQIVNQHGTDFQPAKDYRNAQKGGASAEELSRYAPSNVGLGEEWINTSPITESELSQGIRVPGGAGEFGGGAGFGGGPAGVGGVAGQALGDYGNLLGRYLEFADENQQISFRLLLFHTP